MLEAALLPESLPSIPGVEIEALYRAAGELSEAGGDFYDVLAYGAGRWMLVIGDVCGKGPRAAGVTALARHTLRTAAMLGQSPAGMLETLHEALRHQPRGADLCTACLVTLEPERSGERARLTVVLGGHPPPLLIDADGAARAIGVPGTLLGVIDPIEIHEAEAELSMGETLLLYTDGLPEADRSSQAPIEALLGEPKREWPQAALAGVLEQIAQGAVARADGHPRDDIALLAARLVGTVDRAEG